MKKITLFILLMIGKTSFGQLINIENQRIQSDSIRKVTIIDLLYNYQKNNEEVLSQINSSLTHQYKSKNLKNYFLILGNIDYSLANGDELSNSGLVHFRYNRKLNSRIKMEVFTQFQYNKTLGIDMRSLLGIGPRFKVNKSGKVVFYTGVILMQEFEKTNDSNEIISYQRLSNYLSFSFKNSAKSIEFSTVIYYQPNINLWDDYRLNSQTSIAFYITSKLQFVNSINFGYDTFAPINVSKQNLSISNGLKLNI